MRRYVYLLIGIISLLAGGVARSATTAPSYHQIKKIEIGGEGGWDYLSFDSATHRLYVSRSNRVTVLDVDRGVVVGEVPNTPGIHGIALVPRLHRGFTSNGGQNTVTAFDLNTLKELARISVGARPDAILYDPATNRVFTFNGGSNDSTAIDAKTEKVVGTVPLGGRPEFAVADGQGGVFCNIEDKSEVVSIDAKSLTLKKRWSIAPGDGPSGLSMDRAHRRLFSVCRNGMMVVSDADAGRVVATAAIGRGPDACKFDPRLGLAFSSNGRDGTLTLVKEESPNTFSVAATVPTQLGARTMALDPRTHHIYLAAARFAPPPPGEATGRRRPAMQPNSFVVLVFGP